MRNERNVPYLRDEGEGLQGRWNENHTIGTSWIRVDSPASNSSALADVWRQLHDNCRQPHWIAEQLLSLGPNVKIVLAGDSTAEQQYRSLRCVLEAAFAPIAAAWEEGCDVWRLDATGKQVHVCFVWGTSFGALMDKGLNSAKAFRDAVMIDRSSSAAADTRVVAIVGLGAWYKTLQNRYGRDLGRFTAWWNSTRPQRHVSGLSSYDAPTILVLREPLPQHFQSASGVYDPKKEESNTSRSTRCVVARKEWDFRASTFRSANLTSDDVAVLQVYRLLAPLASAHSGTDCTHYSFPANYAMNCELARLIRRRRGMDVPTLQYLAI